MSLMSTLNGVTDSISQNETSPAGHPFGHTGRGWAITEANRKYKGKLGNEKEVLQPLPADSINDIAQMYSRQMVGSLFRGLRNGESV